MLTAGKWMQLGITVLNELSRSQENIMVSLLLGSRFYMNM